MPRWIERRGFTLRLPPAETPATQGQGQSGREALVRLSLVERIGLVRGWFNVREARAEPDADTGQLQALSDGRALSWRWLRHKEAHALLEARLGTLEAMGYSVLDTDVTMRGRWDWLYDLVHRRLRGASDEGSRAAAVQAAPADALRDALTRIGLSPDAVIEGVASVLGLSPHGFAEPDARIIHRTDPEQLGVLLPFLVHHDHPEIRAIGERWLLAPSAAYQIPQQQLQRWLESDDRIAVLLAPRLRPEGLAMLGPEAMVRLSRTGRTDAVREAARVWAGRLH